MATELMTTEEFYKHFMRAKEGYRNENGAPVSDYQAIDYALTQATIRFHEIAAEDWRDLASQLREIA